MKILFSEITQRVTPCIQDISFNVEPKSYKKIDDNRRPHGKERNVDKVLSDGRCSDAHFFSNGIANTEHMPFYKMFETLHNVKIKYLWFDKSAVQI